MLFFRANKFETELGKNIHSVMEEKRNHSRGVHTGWTRGLCPDMIGSFICLSELTAAKRLLSFMIPVGS